MKKWHVTLKHGATGKTKVILMPGGLSEAEARRNACIKAGNYWRAVDAILLEGQS